MKSANIRSAVSRLFLRLVSTSMLMGVLSVQLPTTHAEPAKTESAVDFNRDIRPILSDKCFFCHGPDAEERSADLRLDVAESAYDVIVPGEPDESELLARINDKDDPMPPVDSHKELQPGEIDLLTQ
ncbi:MAG: c-type cytochrome domain-containing protein, partial [Planctomycetota bacterium]